MEVRGLAGGEEAGVETAFHPPSKRQCCRQETEANLLAGVTFTYTEV